MPDERRDWRTLGYTRRQWEHVPFRERREPWNPVWSRSWEELAPHQRRAAEELGWGIKLWEQNELPLPTGCLWHKLDEETQLLLGELGEHEESWNEWPCNT